VRFCGKRSKPNNRSSHTQLTIRGAGVVFPIMGIVGFLATPRYSPTGHSGTLESGFLGNYGFWVSLLMIAIVSFWDDVRPLPPRIRILVQALAVALMVIPLGAEWWIVALAMVLTIGTINAYNFMDGINGITALYSLVAVGTALVMLKLGYKLVLGESVWLALGASLLAFSFYNVRKKARCFMGDVGAVSLAFVLAYWIYGLVLSEVSLVYILFLGVYGLDAVATIWRLPLIVGENAPGNLGAMDKAIRKGYYFRIGNSYERMRYYVRIEELATRVLALLDGKVAESGTFNVISGEKLYGDFEDEIASKYGKKVRSIPLWMVRLAAKVGDVLPGFPLNSYRLKKLLGE
jgi:UDP-N-acetylmuramyl pentapeptide phosphotransferase/UDP-N-acetylglucosamine-1-phosphate transferase